MGGQILRNTQPGIGGCFSTVDADKYPSGCAVYGDEEIATFVFIGHSGQVFHIDMQEPRLICLERVLSRKL